MRLFRVQIIQEIPEVNLCIWVLGDVIEIDFKYTRSHTHAHTKRTLALEGGRGLLRRMTTQSSMATSAPVVRPSEKGRTSGLQVCMFPRLSQAHTRTISVLVLLWMG